MEAAVFAWHVLFFGVRVEWLLTLTEIHCVDLVIPCLLLSMTNKLNPVNVLFIRIIQSFQVFRSVHIPQGV